MEHTNKLIFSAEIYSQFLTTINSVKFSKREIDILACVLNGRSAKGIASFLSISPKTAEAHTYNVMKKLGCTSREGVISLIETSGKFLSLKEYYVSLLRQIAFEKTLKEISSLRSEEQKTCSIVTRQAEEPKNSLLHIIKNHLILAGIKTSIEARENITPGDILVNDDASHYKLYVLPGKWEGIRAKEFFKQVIAEPADNTRNVLFLRLERGEKEELSKESDGTVCLDLTRSENYYFLFFETLRKLLPHANLDSIIEGFKQQCEFSSEPLENKNFQKEVTTEKPLPLSFLQKGFLQERKWHFLIVFIIAMSALGMGFLIPKGAQELKVASIITKQPESPIRSDLILPNTSTLLNRPDLIGEIDDKFKKQGGGIQSVALVGIGGSGKTTLSREYARLQKESVIWEVNAETHVSLMESFENLANSLSRTEEDRGLLRELTDIKKPSEREKKIVEFVKDRLKLYPNWFLIYDNVEKFSDIQKYFPLDSETWGQGRILLTTRDSTIQNHKQIDHAVFIGEMDNTQKLHLLTQIMGNGENAQVTSAQSDETLSFLEKIPPFPLDVSVAAYYLKTTNVPYADYLVHLNKFNKDFTTVQENLLKGAGEYTKTRYGIITLSLEQIMNSHKDFTDLLLFISLLDSQHIPRDLLNNYKDKVIVDNFIYHLKKYSLITDDASSSPIGPAFFMHRSTQDISFSYLTGFLKLKKESPLLEAIAYTLDDYLDQAIEKEDFAKIQLMASHLEKFLTHHDLLTNFSKGLLTSKLASIYYFINNDKVQQTAETSLNLLKSQSLEHLSATDHSRIARALLPIGAVYTELRFDKEAKEVLEKAVQIYGIEGSKNYLDLSRALSHLGDLQKRLGNYEEARGYLEESIRLYKQYGTDNKHVARTLAYLGSVYRGLGLYQKAIDTLEESLAIYEKNYSNDHIRIGWILIHLGNVHRRLGNLKQAKDTLERGLIIFQKHFPENHVSMGLVWAYLGGYYREVGDYEKSCNYLEHSLRIHQKHFDESHVKMGWILFHLASTYKAMNNNKAQKLFDKVLEIYTNHCDEDNIETARMLRNMAKICIEKNRLEDADNYIQRSLKILQSRQHVEAYRSLKTLGEILLKKSTQSTYAKNNQEVQDLRNQAIDNFNQALKIAKQHFPKDSVHIQKIHSRIESIQK